MGLNFRFQINVVKLYNPYLKRRMQGLSAQITSVVIIKPGYVIFIFLPGDTFIYEKIPIKIWDEYKKSVSPDLYYENNILNNYRCVSKQLRVFNG
jgi:hypothetical protein